MLNQSYEKYISLIAIESLPTVNMNMIYTKLRNLSLFVDRAIILSVVEMVYCLLYYCSTLSAIEKTVIFLVFQMMMMVINMDTLLS